MGRGPKLGRGARWAVPAAAVLTVGAVVAGTTMAGAQASPELPSRTAAQLLADVQQATGPGPLTATVQETANLGLPSLPGSGNSTSAMSLLSGTHSFNIWYADPAHVRVAQPVQLGESDLRRDGRQVWLWNSKNETATHVVLPSVPAGSADGNSAGDSPASPAPPPTPQNLARQILAAVGPTTTVSVQQNVSVAGQSAYQLAVAPKDSGSLIGRVTIAVDAHRYLPLRVQVFARGASSPAFELGFTSLSFGQPAASNFAFTPPPGAKVKTIQVPAKFRPGKAIGRHHHGWYGYSPRTGDRFPGHPGAASPVTVMGKGWLSVLAVSASQSPDNPTTTTTTFGSTAYSSVTSPASGTQVASGPGGQGRLAAQAQAIARTLMHEATPVSGSWGSGRLLRTSLVSVLITSKGTVYIGAVQPSVLYADAAASK